jgi:7-cyano-7-deazaguanine synthase
MGCSVNGCILFERERAQEELKAIDAKLRELIVRAEDRGRDSYGVLSFKKDGTFTQFKRSGRPSESLQTAPLLLSQNSTIVINNNRAEPTTEYVRNKGPSDIQPFGKIIYVSHNGIIANDRELERKYHLSRTTAIDSAIISPLLEAQWDDSLDSLAMILGSELLGSFALAIVSAKRADTLFLACNYKPLFLEYEPLHDVLYFSSLEQYLQSQNQPIWKMNPVRQMSPYSVLSISTNRSWSEASIPNARRPSKRERTLVVCSAGLDSTVAAKLMIDRGDDVSLLHFKYGQRAEEREESALKAIGASLGCKVQVVELDLFKKVVGHSRLTETLSAIESGREGEAGAEFAHEWVPARNLVFLSVAVAIAEARGYGVVALGNNLEEAGAYPDNEMIFVQKLNDVLPYATNLNKRVRLEMPVGNLMKHEIVKLGMEIEAPLALTWSCYEGGLNHCGKCGPCYMRRKGFQINGWKDVVTYTEESTAIQLS